MRKKINVAAFGVMYLFGSWVVCVGHAAVAFHQAVHRVDPYAVHSHPGDAEAAAHTHDTSDPSHKCLPFEHIDRHLVATLSVPFSAQSVLSIQALTPDSRSLTPAHTLVAVVRDVGPPQVGSSNRLSPRSLSPPAL